MGCFLFFDFLGTRSVGAVILDGRDRSRGLLSSDSLHGIRQDEWLHKVAGCRLPAQLPAQFWSVSVTPFENRKRTPTSSIALPFTPPATATVKISPCHMMPKIQSPVRRIEGGRNLTRSEAEIAAKRDTKTKHEHRIRSQGSNLQRWTLHATVSHAITHHRPPS